MATKSVRLSLQDFKSNRDARRRVIRAFLKEKPGKGTGGLASRYKYVVESLPRERQLFLVRPTRKYGMDFEIWVEKYENGVDGRPSYDDIFRDLRRKRSHNRTGFNQLYGFIRRVYSLEEPDGILSLDERPKFKEGFRVEMLLKTLKWLFVEQDVTYWNYSGRAKLMRAIDKIAGPRRTRRHQ